MKINVSWFLGLFCCFQLSFLQTLEAQNIGESHTSKQTFASIVDKYKGKIIYVDFWASWCKPCRKEIHKVKKIETPNSDIVFIYISIDLDRAQCEAAIKKDNVITKENHYYLMDLIKGEWFKKLKFGQSIPYYVLIDKNRQHVLTNAARPSMKNELQTQFDIFRGYEAVTNK